MELVHTPTPLYVCSGNALLATRVSVESQLTAQPDSGSNVLFTLVSHRLPPEKRHMRERNQSTKLGGGDLEEANIDKVKVRLLRNAQRGAGG